jgi:hypothetical protein
MCHSGLGSFGALLCNSLFQPWDSMEAGLTSERERQGASLPLGSNGYLVNC